MVLRVELEHFPSAVERVLSQKVAYVAPSGAGSVVTAADARGGPVVYCLAPNVSPLDATARLRDSGMEVHEGAWSLQAPQGGAASDTPYVAAVAYTSDDTKPGVWVEAFAELPTMAEVLRAMYDEFVATGEAPEGTSVEDFVRLANPNVVILSPEQLARFVQARSPC